MAKATITVGAHSVNPTKTVVRARNFEMIIDEPRNLGGTDEGPTPVEYVLGALAGCLTVVGHVVAREMAFELRGVTFELAGDLDSAKFLGQSAANRAGFQEIRVKVRPDSDASQQQLDAWLKTVGNRCPVSDNLANATPVQLTL